MKKQIMTDMLTLVAAVVLMAYGFKEHHRVKNSPRETRITSGIGGQLYLDIVTTNRFAVWCSTSNGPAYKNAWGTWTVRLPDCYTGVTIYRTQTYW